MKLAMILIIVLLGGAFFIVSNQNIKLNNNENINLFFEEYVKWIDGLIINGKSITNYIIKNKWLP
jgi:hypothetical protein